MVGSTSILLPLSLSYLPRGDPILILANSPRFYTFIIYPGLFWGFNILHKLNNLLQLAFYINTIRYS